MHLEKQRWFFRVPRNGDPSSRVCTSQGDKIRTRYADAATREKPRTRLEDSYSPSAARPQTFLGTVCCGRNPRDAVCFCASPLSPSSASATSGSRAASRAPEAELYVPPENWPVDLAAEVRRAVAALRALERRQSAEAPGEFGGGEKEQEPGTPIVHARRNRGFKDEDYARLETQWLWLMQRVKHLGPISRGNCVKIYHEGDKAFASMLGAIKGAKKTVLMESYIFDNSHIGRAIKDALCDAARRGCFVLLVIDWVGSFNMPVAWQDELVEAGVNVVVFNPPLSLLLSGETSPSSSLAYLAGTAERILQCVKGLCGAASPASLAPATAPACGTNSLSPSCARPEESPAEEAAKETDGRPGGARDSGGSKRERGILWSERVGPIPFRDHRKNLIVDGQLAFVGSLNVSQDAVGEQFGGCNHFYDLHVRLRGPAVKALEALMLETVDTANARPVRDRLRAHLARLQRESAARHEAAAEEGLASACRVQGSESDAARCQERRCEAREQKRARGRGWGGGLSQASQGATGASEPVADETTRRVVPSPPSPAGRCPSALSSEASSSSLPPQASAGRAPSCGLSASSSSPDSSSSSALCPAASPSAPRGSSWTGGVGSLLLSPARVLSFFWASSRPAEDAEPASSSGRDAEGGTERRRQRCHAPSLLLGGRCLGQASEAQLAEFGDDYEDDEDDATDVLVQVLESNVLRNERSIQAALKSAIYNASVSLYVTAAYFVPPGFLRRALQSALSRDGVDVNILVSGESDVWGDVYATTYVVRKFLTKKRRHAFLSADWEMDPSFARRVTEFFSALLPSQRWLTPDAYPSTCPEDYEGQPTNARASGGLLPVAFSRTLPGNLPAAPRSAGERTEALRGDNGEGDDAAAVEVPRAAMQEREESWRRQQFWRAIREREGPKGKASVYFLTARHCHAKNIVVDHLWSTIGSFNFDRFSSRRNMEVLLAFLDPTIAAKFEGLYWRQMQDGAAEQMTVEKWNSQTLVKKILCFFCYYITRFAGKNFFDGLSDQRNRAVLNRLLIASYLEDMPSSDLSTAMLWGFQ
ncbi:hypothetical protein BESB_071330 [Besnoitia besnoiti]|uniref:PLD phosphodiesterase domain-containing protein n=1 Tax=Besnoitia besnoiti TaxID=94643 RepID=A0A2A9MCD7_BESBE|nr:uncharacterized protein BESB_071330 [Besnoitia besnoiti]PFH33981.1 hypothetical protein BESB_071330 [Besnoitia besnoiti]